jgi:HprK-related kinase B
MTPFSSVFKEIDQLITQQSFKTSHFDFGNFVVEVHFNDLGLQQKLLKYYQKFVVKACSPHATVIALNDLSVAIEIPMITKQPDPGKTKIKEKFCDEGERRIISKIITGVDFFYDFHRFVATGPLLDNDNQLVNFINNIYMDIQLILNRGQLFHAAALCSEKKGMGMAGQSGKGKSTLCLKMLGEGIHFVSNDRLMVSQNQEALLMAGIPKYPRINPGTILNNTKLVNMISAEDRERYESLPNDSLWELEEKYDGIIEEHFDDCNFILQAHMDYFVVINWDRNSDHSMTIDEISLRERRELLPHIMKAPGILVPKSRKRLEPLKEEDYLNLLDQCTVLELSGSVNFDRAARELRALL